MTVENHMRVGSASRRRVAVRDVVRTIYIHGTLLLALLLFMMIAGPVLLLAGVTFDRKRRLARRAVRAIFPRLVRHYAWLAGNPVSVTCDRAALQALGPCIVVANHASCMDVVLLMMLPGELGMGRVWAKDWPFKIPLLGWLMRLSGHLFVHDFNILPDARDCLADGSSLLVFPESSRSRTGKAGRFREGAFLLAARTGRPVVVVAIRGSYECMPAGQPWVYRPKLSVEVLGILQAAGTGARESAVVRREAQRLVQEAVNGRSSERSATTAAA